MISGLLYVDKPAGISSHDVVGVVRRAARSRRVGHAGTLDPFATGLLVIAIGPCTRLLPYIVGEPKCYEATIAFGTETDTDDRTGTVVRTAPAPDAAVLRDPQHGDRLAAEQQLTGQIAQVPPAYSAKHVGGQRAYDLARKGREVTLAPVMVHVMGWEWCGATDSTLEVRITCGGGTYIRALARDLGRALGSAAHCQALRRVSSGPAHVQDAVPYTALAPGAIADGTVTLRSPLEALGSVARESLDDTDLIDLRHGRPVRARHEGEQAAFLRGTEVIGMGRRNAAGRWQPTVVLLGAEEAAS
ncbi:MAG: tRNA pseudouridine(55) synthase TruB [Gemmatimonadaceae bacterium]|nr:tRNA pseudouridine(55) synthase TruB [Gemmatimonadaceae bacterium]